MGKYEPLATKLKETSSDVLDASFDEIEDILKFQLPPSARRHRTWWGNCYKGTHSQAKGWIEAGWETRHIDLDKEVVRFQRAATPNKISRDDTTIDYWDEARRFTGIMDRNELEKAAANALVRQVATERLIALGGTMPDLVIPARERPSV
jgi:hypothetical protein